MRRQSKHQLLAATLTLTLLLCAGMSLAEDGGGGQAGEFLRYGSDVRSLAMGRATSALASGPAGFLHNPAALMRSETRYSTHFTHFRPLYESKFSFFSIALPRPGVDTAGLGAALFGPKTAWGAAFVSFGSDGYEYRDANDLLVQTDDFGLFSRAWVVGFARESVSPTGILSWGLNLKLIHQGVNNSDLLEDSDMGVGLDFGAQLQLINPPRPLSGLSLSKVMPLRLGLSIQNLLAPKVGYGGTADEFPRICRLGWSYRISSCFLHKSSDLTLVNDWEFGGGRGLGKFFGAEWDWTRGDMNLALRTGLSHDNSIMRATAGVGIRVDRDSYDLQFDYAHGHHGEFADDQRVSLSIFFGSRRGGDYHASVRPRHNDNARREADLQIVARHPASPVLVKEAATRLAETLDPVHEDRYYRLIRGVEYGNRLFERALEAHRADDAELTRERALMAIEWYDLAHQKDEGSFDDVDYLNWAEANLMIEDWDATLALLDRGFDNTLRMNYLAGVANLGARQWDEAAARFGAAAAWTGDDDRDMRYLSRLGLGQALLSADRFVAAIDALRSLTGDEERRLEETYPRFPEYPDGVLLDDAQYLIARCYLGKGDLRTAAAEMVKICRFFHGLDRCSDAQIQSETERLIQEGRR